METSAREMVNIEETFAREGSLFLSLFSFFEIPNEDRIGTAHWSFIYTGFLIA